MITVYTIGFKSVGKFLIDCLSTLETARNEMELMKHISVYNSPILRQPYAELFRSYFGLQAGWCRTIPILLRFMWRGVILRVMWRDKQSHGYSRPILILHSAKCVLDCRQNYHGCRQNKLQLLWNALLTTLYISKHYKHMFLVARDLYEMLVLSRRKHTPQRSTVGIWSEVRVYHTPATNIPWAGVLRLGKFPDKRRLKS